MSALKDLRLNGLKDLKINGLKYLKINELKHLIPKPGGQDDSELGDLIKNKKEVEAKIRELFREKKEIESRIEKKEIESRIEKKKIESKIEKEEIESRIEKEEIESRNGQLQETKNEEIEEIPEFPWREEIFPPLRRNMHRKVSGLLEVETGALQKEDTEIPERTDSQTGKKVENLDKSPESKETGEIEGDNITEIEVKEEAKSAREKNDVRSNKEDDPSNIRKKSGEIDLPENIDKTKTVEPSLEYNKNGKDKTPILENNEKEENINPEKGKTESEKPVPGILGNSLIQELLESEDLYLEEEQNFMKYIGEPSVAELLMDLREVKKLLAGTES